MIDVVTIGGASRDIFFETDEGILIDDPKKMHEMLVAFDYGSKIISDSADFVFGGGSLNSSVAFKRLGLSPVPIFAVGSDENGREILELLKREKIRSDFVETQKHPTAISFFIRFGDDHVGFLYRGANDHLQVQGLKSLSEVKWFYISSLTGNSARCLPEVLRIAKKMDIKVSLNPGNHQLEMGYDALSGIVKDIDLLILNIDEAEELVLPEEKNFNGKNHRLLLWKVYEMGPQRVLLTDGDKGSYFTDGNDFFYQEACKTVVKDTTGAGDAFGSTFVACLLKGYNYQEALKMASVNAASVVEKVGAQAGLLTDGATRARRRKVFP